MNILRTDITGLRAIAVLAVVLYHIRLPGFDGGFIGVDVFFVISGYLITRKILLELAEGKFSFYQFYLSRLRRLFPALLVTIAVTFLIGAVLLSPSHLSKLAQSSIYATIAASNIYFWTESGYWDSSANLKPLLHTWSLAVEEQFYFIWPAFLVLLVNHLKRWIMPVALLAVTVAGLLLAQYWLKIDPSGSFYLTPFRVCEFSIGGLLVYLDKYRSRIQLCEDFFAILGLSLILFSVFYYDKTTPFPGTSVILPCVGTVLMIYASKSRITKIWNNRHAEWIGLRSYSMYLVHWPLIVLYEYWRFEPISRIEQLGLLVGTIVLSIPLYKFIEQKYRYATPRSWIFRTSIATVGLSLFAIFFSAWQQDGWRWRLLTNPDPEIERMSLRPCEDGYGLCPGGVEVALIGDSHAVHFTPSIANLLKQMEMSGRRYPVANNCSLLSGVHMVYKVGEKNACNDQQEKWFAAIKKEDPKVIILASFWPAGVGVSGRLVQNNENKLPSLNDARALFNRALRMSVNRLINDGRKVIILGSTPFLNRDPSVCFEQPLRSNQKDCVSQSKVENPDVHAYLDNTFRSIEKDYDNVFYFDTFGKFCNETGCKVSEGSISFFRDRHHLTSYGVFWLQHHHFEDLEIFLNKS